MPPSNKGWRMAKIWISMLLSVGLPRVSFFFIRLTNAPENPRNGNGVGEGHSAFSAAATINQDVRKVKILCGRSSGSGLCGSIDKLYSSMASIFRSESGQIYQAGVPKGNTTPLPCRNQVYVVSTLDGGEEQASSHQRTPFHLHSSTQIPRKNQEILELLRGWRNQ